MNITEYIEDVRLYFMVGWTLDYYKYGLVVVSRLGVGHSIKIASSTALWSTQLAMAESIHAVHVAITENVAM